MYQPVIQDDLIMMLYRYAKATGQPMTKAIDKILREFLKPINIEEKTVSVKEPLLKKVYSITN